MSWMNCYHCHFQRDCRDRVIIYGTSDNDSWMGYTMAVFCVHTLACFLKVIARRRTFSRNENANSRLLYASSKKIKESRKIYQKYNQVIEWFILMFNYLDEETKEFIRQALILYMLISISTWDLRLVPGFHSLNILQLNSDFSHLRSLMYYWYRSSPTFFCPDVPL